MAKITQFKGYDSGDAAPGPPKPEVPPEPMVVTVQDGVPVAYPGCHGVGVRVVHPANARAPARKGDFVYPPPWCVHGIENTGRDTLVVLICTSPPNP